MEVDGPHLPNGHGPSIVGRPLVNGTSTGANDPAPVLEVQYDCNKCHWRRINDPESLHKPVKEPEPTPVAEAVRSPPRHPVGNPFVGHPPPLPPQQHLPGWPPFGNGNAASPPAPMHLPPHQHPSNYPPAHGPSATPGFAVGPPPLRHGVYAPPPGHAPNPGPAPLHVIHAVVPNGLPSPRGAPPLRSPTHPPPLGGPPMHRQGESPFTGPPPGAPYNHAPFHHHGSPVLPAAPLPANGPRPSTPRDGPLGQTTLRLPHGASASPNVRNILND
jgi:formin 2